MVLSKQDAGISQNDKEFKTENLGLDPQIFAKILELYQKNNYAHLTGIKIVAMGPGKLITEMVAEKHNSNMAGTLHGGAIAALVDVSMGMACFTKGISVVTGDMNISYLATGKAGSKVLAIGQVIKAGKTAFFTEASVEDEAGRIIAKGTGTFFVKENFVDQ